MYYWDAIEVGQEGRDVLLAAGIQEKSSALLLPHFERHFHNSRRH